MNLPQLLGGVSEAFSATGQPLGTSYDALNACGTDQFTRRMRLSSREGLGKYNTTQLANAKVQHVATMMVDSRRTTYSLRTTAVAGDLTVKDTATPSKTGTADGVVDEFGNVYVLDGPASIAKFNPDLRLIWRFSVQVRDQAHVLGTIELDPDGRLYVGVTSGGAQETASLWAFDPDDGKKLSVLWRIDTKAYVARIKWREGTLVTAQDDVATGRSAIVVYEFVDTKVPSVASVQQRAHPIGDFAINTAGEVATTHPANSARWLDPRYPTLSYIFDVQRWNPTQLVDFSKRIWCWLRADKIGDQLGFENIQDGDEVTEWRDWSGNQRNLYADTSLSTYKAPIYREKGFGGKPVVEFKGDWNRLISFASMSAEASEAETNPTLIPTYKTSAYCIIIVCKPTEHATRYERLFQQHNDNPTGTAGDRQMWLNQTTAGVSSGRIQNLTKMASGTEAAFNSVAAAGRFDNKNSWSIITFVSDNNQLGSAPSPQDKGQWRVNGVPIAKGKTRALWAVDDKTIIGCLSDGTRGPHIQISDIFVLRDYVDAAGNKVLLTLPDYDGVNSGGTYAPTATYDPDSDTEVERLEGWFAWKYGMSHLLDDGAQLGSSLVWDAEGGSTKFKHPFSSDDPAQGPPNPGGKDSDTIDVDLLSADPMTVKGSTQRGNVRWVNIGSGQGYGIVVDQDDNWVTVGPKTATDNASVRKLNDSGSTVGTAWTKTGYDSGGTAVDFGYNRARLAVDTNNNVYIPFNEPTAVAQANLWIIRSDATERLFYSLLNTGLLSQAIAIDPRYPPYGVKLPERVIVLTTNGGDDAQPSVHAVRLVDSEQSTGTVRESRGIAVSEGNIVGFDNGSRVTPISQGAGVLSATARYVASAQSGSKLFFTDGENYVYYDALEDECAPWEATSAGGLPKRCLLICNWRNRIFLGRGDGDPHNWHALAKDDPFDANQFPATVTATQAISGNNAVAGEDPDILNSFIPADRERLIMGGDHTINIMYGDPMEGGSIVEVSDKIGIAFGSPWAKDESGTIYFFGSRGGCYRMKAGSHPEKISDLSFDKRMQSVDFAEYRVEMAWMAETDTLRVFQIPYGAGGTVKENWRWERKTGGWWPEKFAVAWVQPTCVCVHDGDDPADRVILMGTEGGYILKIDLNAVTDDGYAIDSYVTWWPIMNGGAEVRIRNPKITLADDAGSCVLQLLSSETPDRIGTAKEEAVLHAGQNERAMIGVRGTYCGVRLRNAAPGQRWAFESGLLDVYPAGR